MADISASRYGDFLGRLFSPDVDRAAEFAERLVERLLDRPLENVLSRPPGRTSRRLPRRSSSGAGKGTDRPFSVDHLGLGSGWLNRSAQFQPGLAALHNDGPDAGGRRVLITLLHRGCRVGQSPDQSSEAPDVTRHWREQQADRTPSRWFAAAAFLVIEVIRSAMFTGEEYAGGPKAGMSR